MKSDSAVCINSLSLIYRLTLEAGDFHQLLVDQNILNKNIKKYFLIS